MLGGDLSMENNNSYTSEELDELYRIIFLGITDEESASNGRILMDANAFKDQETLNKYLKKELERANTIRHPKMIREFTEVQEVLFCNKRSLPLYINHRLNRVIKWRLDHGK